MKNSKILFLSAVVMMTVSLKGIDLEQYITGEKVGPNGETILHVIAENCDNNEFTVELKPFNGIYEELQEEVTKLIMKAALVSTFSEAKQNATKLAQAKKIVMAKDNNGETALDIFKRKSIGINSCQICLVGMQLLDDFEQFIAEQEK